MTDLFKELEKAISEGDSIKIEKLRKRVLLDDRDETLDRDFIDSIKGNGTRNKTLYMNMRKAIKDEVQEDWVWYAKLVSSLITHILIESQVRDRDLSEYPITDLYSLLGDFILNREGSRDSCIEKCIDFISTRYFSFIDE